MESLDGSEPLTSAPELIDHDEFQRAWESIRDSWDDDIPQHLLSCSSEEPVVADGQSSEQPELGNQSLVPSGPLDCSQCVLLREAIHSNGSFYVRLSFRFCFLRLVV